MNATPALSIDDIAVGTMKMLAVDGRRVCVVRTAAGVHAIDHACPHEGYGLTQGELDGDLLTCAWHNWKFRVSDGRCVIVVRRATSTRRAVVGGGGATELVTGLAVIVPADISAKLVPRLVCAVTPPPAVSTGGSVAAR